jgi:transcriptional regulator with XRE-family HTH domain
VAARASPLVQRRRVGMQLRYLRDAAGLTIEQVANALECSESKISRIETGQVRVTPRDVRDMLELYSVSGQQRDVLLQTAREARGRGWWHPYSDLPLATLVGLEAAAASISDYEPLLVPTLLQTVEYARSTLRAAKLDLPPEEIERLVEFSMARQRLLFQEEPPRLWIVLDEAALHRLVGGREVMREQLHRLDEVARLPFVTLQIMPYMAGEHAGMNGAFTILSFADPSDPDVVYLAGHATDAYLEEPMVVRRYWAIFDHLRAASHGPSDSAAFLTRLIKDL